MKFSVITCTWNSIAFLKQCLDSVTSQTHQNIEFVFVDGGSNDGTLELIDEINLPKKIAHGVQGGISAAMNRGVELASGDVIVHLHSDDYFAHTNVLARVNMLLSNSDKLWLFGRCLSDIDGTVHAEPYKIPKYSYTRLLKGNFIPHPATFIRKQLFEQVGLFNTNIKYAMDYDLWLRFGCISDPIQLDEHLSVFRRHQGSLSTANRLAAFEEDYAVRCKYVEKSLLSRIYHHTHYIIRSRRIRQMLPTEVS